MGIQLDWEVESDAGSEAVQEDALVVASRQRRQVWNRRMLIVLTGVLALIAAAGVWRYRLVRQAMREALQATVESEALALRLGDQHKFMQFQGPAEEWREKQRLVFSQFERAGAAIEVTGKVLDLHLAGSEARVAVEVIVDEAPQEAVWLYEYTPEKGWKHVATEVEPWSMADHEYEWFTLTYFASDSDAAETVNSLYSTWWAKAINTTHYPTAPPRLTIVLDPDAESAGWKGEDYSRLILPIERDGDAAPINAAVLKGFAAEYWAYTAYAHEIPQGYRWLANETELYFMHLFDPSETPSAFFDALTAAYGSNVLPSYFAMMRDGNPNPVETLRTAIDVTSPTDLEGDALLAHLTAALRAEAFSSVLTNAMSSPITSPRVTLFMDEFSSEDSYEMMPVTTGTSAPEAIEVRSAEVQGDLLWARVRYGVLQGQEPPGAIPQVYETYIPFRRIGNRWVHTWLRRNEDTGLFVEQGEEGSLVTLIYDGIDEPLVKGMQPQLEGLYRQAAADFGIIEPLPVTVAVVLDGGILNQGDVPQDYVYITSIYGQCCLTADAQPRDVMRRYIAEMLIFRTYGSRVDYSYVYSVFDWVLINREAERLGMGPMSWMETVLAENIQPVDRVILPTTISEVVYSASLDQYDDATRYRTAATLLGGEVLIDLIVDRYGEAGIIALLDRLSVSGSLDAWFEDALGITATDLEAEWLALYDTALRERFGIGLAGQ